MQSFIFLLLTLTSAQVMAKRQRPQAIVYRGPAASEGLPESVAYLLQSSPRNFEVRYAGPNEDLSISAETLRDVSLYAQPGGPDVDEAWDELEPFATPIRDFVAGGGRYLGFCLGAYLAGHSPGLNLVPKNTDVGSEIEQNDAQITDDKDSIIQIDWTYSSGEKAGQTVNNTWIYFQEGAVMENFKPDNTTFILGRYSKNGDVAASVSQYGKGWVGLIGPHPEADQTWFDEYDLDHPDGLRYDIGYDLIEATMNGGPQKSNTSQTQGASPTQDQPPAQYTSGASRSTVTLGSAAILPALMLSALV
ncbi:unnamed protein product [Zymoseptoria tritici ST99CH_1A5]|nr:unnamed protein product [Zymoseptoria tritici ST99CH_1E4]SMY29340.1 unnamed protein product [Zymoseptoria tritici ST99CH_1A5]